MHVMNPPRQQIRFAPFRLDLVEGRLYRGAEQVELPPKPFQLLQYLAERPGRLICKEELFSHVWPGVFVGDEVLKVAISALRKALNDPFREPRYIETAHRRGYRFIAKIDNPRLTPLTVMRWADVQAYIRESGLLHAS